MADKLQRQAREAADQYATDVQLNDAKYRQWRQSGFYGVAAGFVLLIVVSLFLAFLSMERHTRALEQVTSLMLANAPKVARDESA
ncbi:MAG: hypothetical protein K0R38_5526 [Polyangiaceae bacterium]|nr:hypothetical protein [Polyangiaceae bacterium]